MRSVKVNKKELMTILADNKKKHVKEFEEAVKDYKKAALKVAKEHVELAKTGELDKIAKIRSMPNGPISYEDSYNRAIRMMELSVDEVIELEEQIFNQLVLDEWMWKQAFVASASLYKTI